MSTAAVDRVSGLDALLAHYVAGSLSQPLAALCAAHLDLSPGNRGYVRALEAAAGRRLEEAADDDAVPIRDRDAKLAAILGLPALASARPAARAPSGVLPAALRRYLGRDLEAVPWKTMLPGIKHWHIADTEAGEASLYWIRAGQRLPTHTHDGSEVTLVLAGGFSDVTGHFVRGDVAVADEDLDHRPVADDDGEDCLCFAVTDAPLRLTGPVGRLVQPFLGR